MKGVVVLVRGFGDRPFVGKICSEGPKGARIAHATADLDDVSTCAAGVPWDDIFVFDKRLTRELEAAVSSSNPSQLGNLWVQAKPFNRNRN